MLKHKEDIRDKILQSFKEIKDKKVFENLLETPYIKGENFILIPKAFSPVLKNGEETGNYLTLYLIKSENEDYILISQDEKGIIDYSKKLNILQFTLLTTNNNCFLACINKDGSRTLYLMGKNKKAHELTDNIYVWVENHKKVKENKLYKKIIGKKFFNCLESNKIVKGPFLLYESCWKYKEEKIKVTLKKNIIDKTLTNDYYFYVFEINHENKNKENTRKDLYLLGIKKQKGNKTNTQVCFTGYLTIPEKELTKNKEQIDLEISIIPSYCPYFTYIEGETYLKLYFSSLILVKQKLNDREFKIVGGTCLIYNEVKILQYLK
jgi:hypothetical protein